MLVIGNGESRKALKIEELNLPTVGCNAIFRDIKVDHLVCCDRRMVREAIKHSNTSQSIIYSRPDWCNEFNVFPVPDLPTWANCDRMILGIGAQVNMRCWLQPSIALWIIFILLDLI